MGSDAEVLALAGPAMQRIQLRGRPVLPGLCENPIHIIRDGLKFNLELRWDDIKSLADAMVMLRWQVAITPPPQWVRMVGGFSEHQIAERHLPTLDERNKAAPDTPVFILRLYDRALLNGAALRAVGCSGTCSRTPRSPAASSRCFCDRAGTITCASTRGYRGRMRSCRGG